MLFIEARRFTAAYAAFFLLAPFVHAANRPLPEDVNAKAFARPEPGRLELLVRVPIAAVKDIEFPREETPATST